jgi:O-antigen/teichoic acid export membrane protein
VEKALNPYRKLGGQALIYGLGNIVPRILNYAVLTVYYTRRFSPIEYGVITELYAYVAIFMVLLTYGMETGLFKFSSDSSKKEIVYTTALSSIITTSLIFSALVILFRNNIASWIGYKGNPEYIIFLGLTLSLDAVGAIIFAKLRIENKVRRFALLKILNVITTVVLVFLFLELMPRINCIINSIWYLSYFKDIEVGYVFIANFLASLIILLFLLYDLKGIKLLLHTPLLRKLLLYSIPLLISGLAGIFNETIDRILLRQFSAENLNPLYEIGIYGANYRIAVLMTIFVQMFRYAAEPFFFNWSKSTNSKLVYANVLKYFTIFLMVIFLGVSLCIDFFKLFIDSEYHEGLKIVPIVLMANVLVGMLFNVNMWYKLTGHTLYGVYITGLGAIITVILNIVFIPIYGYFACAWIHLLSNFVMLLMTYYFGQKFYRIDYDLGRIALYVGMGLLLFIIGYFIQTKNGLINVAIGIIIVFIYLLICNKKERLTNIFLNKNEN